MEVDPHARRKGQTALVGRLTAAHFLCYPLMFVAAATGMSLAIVLQADRLRAAELGAEPVSGFQRWVVEDVGLAASEAAVFEVIMRPVAIVLIAIFLLAHAASIPWAMAARRLAMGTADEAAVARARRIWLGASLGPTAIVALAGLVGWIIIFVAGG